MAAHTPGPWKSSGAGIDACMVSTTLNSGRRVSFRVASCKDGDRDTVSANARLIAAAPDLLAAILNSDDAHWTPAMRAAVTKATRAA